MTTANNAHPPLRTSLFLLLCVAWIMPGLVGHDPWKPDEAANFGLVYHMLQTGEWLVPALAGEPVLTEPPLYYLVSAACAGLFSPLLPLHDGARLATGFFMLVTFVFIGMAGRELYGKEQGWLSALVLMGCLGLLLRGHQIIPDVALLAGSALAIYGLALSLRRPGAGGTLMGTGIGIAFLSSGLLAPILALGTLLLLPAFRPWRNRNYGVALTVAALTALPWLTIWPYVLHVQKPLLFDAWLSGEMANLPGVAPVTAGNALYYVKALPWFAWPALPLAAWALWYEGAKSFAQKPGMHMPVVAFLVILAGASLSSNPRDVEALPQLLPLALLGAAGVPFLRRGAANSLYWFAVMGFSFLALVAWFYWMPLALGIPARLSAHLDRMRPGYTFGFRLIPFLVGVAYTAAWIALLLTLKRSKERPVLAWAGGITLVAALLMSLLVGYIDHAKSYRSVVSSLRTALPERYHCIASIGVGEPQRAMFQYFGNIVTQRAETGSGAQCRLLLVQGDPRNWEDPEGSWQQLWEGSRPRDKTERFVLYQAQQPPQKPPRRVRRTR